MEAVITLILCSEATLEEGSEIASEDQAKGDTMHTLEKFKNKTFRE